jgi:hypothetical protein
MPVSEVAKICAVIIKGFAESIALRYNKLMLPVTAGKDSRVLLAATKDFWKNIYFYLNKEPQLSEKDSDFAVSKRLLSRLIRTLKQFILGII